MNFSTTFHDTMIPVYITTVNRCSQDTFPETLYLTQSMESFALDECVGEGGGPYKRTW